MYVEYEKCNVSNFLTISNFTTIFSCSFLLFARGNETRGETIFFFFSINFSISMRSLDPQKG